MNFFQVVLTATAPTKSYINGQISFCCDVILESIGIFLSNIITGTSHGDEHAQRLLRTTCANCAVAHWSLSLLENLNTGLCFGVADSPNAHIVWPVNVERASARNIGHDTSKSIIYYKHDGRTEHCQRL